MVPGFGEHVAPAAGSQTGAFAMWNLSVVCDSSVCFVSFVSSNVPFILPAHCRRSLLFPLSLPCLQCALCFLAPHSAFHVNIVMLRFPLLSTTATLVPCSLHSCCFWCLRSLCLFVSVSVSLVRKGIAGHYSSPTSVAVALLCMVPVCCFAGL